MAVVEGKVAAAAFGAAVGAALWAAARPIIEAAGKDLIKAEIPVLQRNLAGLLAKLPLSVRFMFGAMLPPVFALILGWAAKPTPRVVTH
jgi:hypothetical protein